MRGDICSLIVVLVLGALWLVSRSHRQRQHPSDHGAATLKRLLKPRTADDCPICRRHGILLQAAPVPPPPRPWRELKSCRGAPRRIITDGFACPNAACADYQITDSAVHALVGDGTHGKRECSQTFAQRAPGQACQTTFTARRDTPLSRLKTASTRIALVLSAVAEGLSVAAAVRVFGPSEGTITPWLTRAGRVPSGCSATLHDRWFRHLHLPHLQLDELRTRLRNRAQVRWLWVALDPRTKLLPVRHLGARTQHAAHVVVHDLRHRLAPDCLPVVTSDGRNLYVYALTAHFGQWVEVVGGRARQWQVRPGLIDGQVKKIYRRRKVVRVTCVMRCGTGEDLPTGLVKLGLSGRLNTAFVERVNLCPEGAPGKLWPRWRAGRGRRRRQRRPCWPNSNGGAATITLCDPLRPCACPSPNRSSAVGGDCRSGIDSGRRRWQQG